MVIHCRLSTEVRHESLSRNATPGKGPSSFAKLRSWTGISWVSGRFAATPIRPTRGLRSGLQREANRRPITHESGPMRTVYFDYNATTPLDPAIREAMLPFLGEVWGNPSSVHHVGRRARALLDDARDRAARVLGAKPSEVVFTSGGTESANLAIFGTARRLKSKGRHIVASSIEHHAVLHACEYLVKTEGFEVTDLPVNHEGLVSTDTLAQ